MILCITFLHTKIYSNLKKGQLPQLAAQIIAKKGDNSPNRGYFGGHFGTLHLEYSNF